MSNLPTNDEEIVLPMDFDEVTGNEGTNRIVKVTVMGFLNQERAQHAREIEELKAKYEEKMSGLEESESKLQNLTELQYQTIAEYEAQIKQLKLELEDIAEKRDAAVTEKENAVNERDQAIEELKTAKEEIKRLNSHLEDLRIEISQGARKAPTVINYTEELEKAVNEAKKANSLKDKSPDELMNNFLLRQKEKGIDLPEIGVTENSTFLEDQDSDSVNNELDSSGTEPTESEVSAEDVTFSGQIPEIQSPADKGDSEDQRQIVQGGSEVTREEFEKALERINRLERHANLPEAV